MQTQEDRHRVEYVQDVSAADLDEAEAYLGTFLPDTYRRLLLEKGRFRVVQSGPPGEILYEVLHPRESVEHIKRQLDEYQEDQFGDEPEDLEAARQWLARARRLYPFQHCLGAVSDFWCFYLDSSQGQEHFIVNVAHDEYDLDFLTPGVPNPSVGAFDGYSFASFFSWHLKSIEEALART